MKCFFHNEIDAVAICCNCGKGLCPQCIIDTEDKTTCNSEQCKDKIKSINTMLGKNKKTMETSNKVIQITGSIYKNLAIWLLIIACPLLIFGVIKGFHFLTILGVALIVGAIINFIEARKLKKIKY